MNIEKDHSENETISAVTTQMLEQAKQEKKLDAGSVKLLNMEAKYIAKWRKEARQQQHEDAPDKLTGLALSGGGIRSATFSLGVMQALAHHDLLKKFDYLSTVSGGGYIGSAVTWLLSDKANQAHPNKFGINKDSFPFGADDPAPDALQEASYEQQSMLRYLREHGNYLAPGEGINIVSLIGVVLRGMILNLLVWIPILVLVLMLGFYASKEFLENHIDLYFLPIATEKFGIQDKWRDEYLGYEFMFQLGLSIIGALLFGIVIYSVLTGILRGRSEEIRKFSYRFRRWAEKISPLLLIIAALFFIIASLPVVALYFSVIGGSAIIAGIAMHLPSFLKSVSGDKQAPLGVMVPIGAGLFLYGVFVIAFQIANKVYGNVLLMEVMFLFPVITGFFVNLNYISIHRYYRDRLMEAFTPDIESALANETGAATQAESGYLQEISNISKPTGPYHLVNTNAVLVNSQNPVYRNRGGDNFILSPLYCGSNATGWQRTEQYMGGKMTLATAVAISGAAANPNAGVGGKGLTRNRILSLVMALLNLRLGFWAHNPNKTPYLQPNHFRPGAYSFSNIISLLGFSENRSYIQLSDGGHFENMAVYELVRRRLKLILVCDGGADPEFSFSDFQTTVRRIEDDFGAKVKIDEKSGPDQIVPVCDEGTPAYPSEAKFAKQGYMMGTITYANGGKGTLIYLKTTLIEKVSFKVKGYAAENPSFPDQSTADQFFDEVQFEAYRELGFCIANQMLEGKDIKKLFETV